MPRRPTRAKPCRMRKTRPTQSHLIINIQYSPTSYNGIIIPPTSHCTTHGVTSLVHFFNTITYLLTYVFTYRLRTYFNTNLQRNFFTHVGTKLNKTHRIWACTSNLSTCRTVCGGDALFSSFSSHSVVLCSLGYERCGYWAQRAGRYVDNTRIFVER